MERLRKRAEFLYVARGERWVSKAFVLQARRRESEPDAEPRTGFTASRKVGNAVARNRARRRLKAAARAALIGGIAGCDYVLVARPPALTHKFSEMTADLRAAVEGLHRKLDRNGRNRTRRGASEGPADRAAGGPGGQRR